MWITLRAMLHQNIQPQSDSATPNDTKLQIEPEWLKIPEAVRFSRICRSKIYTLIRSGKIRSVSLREEGETKGTRLVSVHSLRRFLESRASGGEEFLKKEMSRPLLNQSKGGDSDA